MDIEPIGPPKGRFVLAEATIARASDLGVNDHTYFTRTHLGGILHAGDSVMGYHLTGTNFNNPQFEALELGKEKYASQIPDVVLVKKYYARKKKSSKNRNWRLKRMNKEEGEMLPRKQDQERTERDYEMFLRDVEEDAELRSTLALYKAEQDKKRAEKMEIDASEAASVVETEGTEGDEVPKIDMEELLDEFDELNVDDEEVG